MKHAGLKSAIAAVGMACAHLADAQAGPIGEDYVAADSVFGLARPADITTGLDGNWLPLSSLAGGPGAAPVGADSIEGYVQEFCGRQTAIIARLEQTSETSFVMTTGPEDTSVTYRLDWLGGSRFSRSFDPDALIAQLGLDRGDDEAAIDRRAQALRQAPREVDVYRTAADILVVQSAGRAEIYGRCPG